jgi:hypothetical protein
MTPRCDHGTALDMFCAACRREADPLQLSHAPGCRSDARTLDLACGPCLAEWQATRRLVPRRRAGALARLAAGLRHARRFTR